MDASGWDKRYAAARRDAGSVWSVGPNATVAQLLADVPPGVGVDLGAGEGRNALWLAARGWRMSAVDFSATGISIGRERAEDDHLGVDWQVADATTWKPSRPLDLVLIAYLHLRQPVLETLFDAIPGWLTPGGRVLIVGHDRDNLLRGAGGPQDPETLYTTDLLARAAHGLAIERCEQVDRAVGQAEPGVGPVVAIDTLLWARDRRGRTL